MGNAFVSHSMEMKVKAKRDEVLATLQKNREQHEAIVAEAREGYIHKAFLALRERMAEVEMGKLVSLHFTLALPVSYIEAYDTAIKMLELHSEDTVELSAVEVRCLMMDEWDWKDSFLMVNKAYSASAAALSEG